jgi:hypothetical protein
MMDIGEGEVVVASPFIICRGPLKIQISSQLLRCVKNFLLTYHPYAALRNFFRALLTIPHGAAFARSGSASPCGAFGRALNF